MLFIFMSFDHKFFSKHKLKSRNDRNDRCASVMRINGLELANFFLTTLIREMNLFAAHCLFLNVNAHYFCYTGQKQKYIFFKRQTTIDCRGPVQIHNI